MRMGKCGQKNADGKKNAENKKSKKKKNEKCGWQKKNSKIK